VTKETAYQIKLPIFEGPFDLLLHLIKENEINIYDIPILQITDQYLEYIDIMKDLNLDIAGEFLVMAATLTHIKSKMLLPKPEPPYEEEAGDPREELVRKLIEYKSFKDAANFLREKEEVQSELFPNKSFVEEDEEEILVDLNVFDLLGAFKTILKKIGGSSSYGVTLDEVSVTEKLNYIMDILSRTSNVQFEDLFKGATTRMELVGTFLALLELIRLKIVVIQQAVRFGSIIIVKAVEDDEADDGND
jgi:segregation and condensation protein A